jgi:hypothetical protein
MEKSIKKIMIIALAAIVAVMFMFPALGALGTATGEQSGILSAATASCVSHAESVKIWKSGNYYKCNQNGYVKQGKYLYHFVDKKMKASKVSAMKRAIKKHSYKALTCAIGKGKRVSKSKSCNTKYGKYDYIYKFGSHKVYTTGNHITYIK